MVVSISSHKGLQIGALPQGGARRQPAIKVRRDEISFCQKCREKK